MSFPVYVFPYIYFSLPTSFPIYVSPCIRSSLYTSFPVYVFPYIFFATYVPPCVRLSWFQFGWWLVWLPTCRLRPGWRGGEWLATERGLTAAEVRDAMDVRDTHFTSFHILPCLPVRSTTFHSVPQPSSRFYDLFQHTHPS